MQWFISCVGLGHFMNGIRYTYVSTILYLQQKINKIYLLQLQ